MCEIAYTKDFKIAQFDDKRFVRDDQTGYYLNSKTLKRLHRYVWEFHNGSIPENHHIHHIDEDKSNNTLANLQLMTFSKHFSYHGKLRVGRDKEWFEKFHAAGIEKAKEWHASDEGGDWHKDHYEKMKDKLHEKHDRSCVNCGEIHAATRKNINSFCSNKCKSAWRRKSGVDNEKRICVQCGKEYEPSKYSKQTTCSRSCSNRKYPRLSAISKSIKS